MPKFFLTIAIAILVYYALKYIGRIFLPLVMKSWINRMTGGQFQQFNQRDPRQNIKKEGEVTITQPKKGAKSSREDEGEFTDYEEVE